MLGYVGCFAVVEVKGSCGAEWGRAYFGDK